MCGICGAIQLGGEPRPILPVDVLDRMTDALTHRGPDERATYASPGVSLGVRRLAIVDVAHGHQPATDESGKVYAIQNGELYNHLEVRRSLDSSHRFSSLCDTELLPHLYEEL